ncbi:hypothetical protein [Streptomyces griseicoloratus]|uniref:hypothetical protein n=1 Tax=Streptomyces griseicoloratus TaxID=2752516 RepID=UPI001CB74B18
MSNLMRTGDYDDRFLKDYDTKLMATERKLTGNGEHGNLAWRNSPATPWLNRIGEDSGADPLTGYRPSVGTRRRMPPSRLVKKTTWANSWITT